MSDLTNELISGKEAWIAKSEGCEVLYAIDDLNYGLGFQELSDKEFMNWDVGRFLLPESYYRFKLKPKTIMINSVEVPAPFKPNDGEFFYCLSPSSDSGYSFNTNKIFSQYGAWRTEDQVKQVVAALRNVFGGNIN